MQRQGQAGCRWHSSAGLPADRQQQHGQPPDDHQPMAKCFGFTGVVPVSRHGRYLMVPTAWPLARHDLGYGLLLTGVLLLLVMRTLLLTVMLGPELAGCGLAGCVTQ